MTCEYFSIVKLSVTLTVLILETFPASFLPKSNNIKCSESSFLSLSKSFAKKLSSLVFFPLGLVPAIGLTVILLSLNLTKISGLAPIIWKSGKLKKYMNGEGLVTLSFL